MPTEVLHVYLHSPLREQAAAGQVNIFNRISSALTPQGWTLVYHADTAVERAKARMRRGYHLFHMQEPFGPNCLCLRRAYHYPFWQIEAVQERWHFDVALARFDPALVDPARAKAFSARWRKGVFGDRPAHKGDFILMPLQGLLQDHRSFQSASPVAMIGATISAFPDRRIIATLHPRETYTGEDHAALAAIAAQHPLFSVQASTAELILGCQRIVTQNSSVALNGYLAHKPAILFAKVDFHHIAGSVPRDGLAPAFAQADGPLPDFDTYWTWFFRHHCINGGAPEAEAQILARFARHGWPVRAD